MVLRDRHPSLRYRVIGDGPERGALAGSPPSSASRTGVEFAGQLAHTAEALRRAREGSRSSCRASTRRSGVAYVEAMAAGIPAIGLPGQPGPERSPRPAPG